MKELEERIAEDGIVREGNVLKVDNFLNHQCDIELYDRMGAEWARLFAGKRIDKILTIEASGIGIACVAATHFDNVPVVFARKTESRNLDGEQYRTQITSYTKGRVYDVIVAKRFLTAGEHVLIIDDFLAMGAALDGLLELCDDAGGHRRGRRHRHREGLPARRREAARARLPGGIARRGQEHGRGDGHDRVRVVRPHAHLQIPPALHARAFAPSALRTLA